MKKTCALLLAFVATVTLFGCNENNKGDNKNYSDNNQTFQLEQKDGEACVDANHVHKVDLGLSVKWACCNVEATSPEHCGGYYAWGETVDKGHYGTDNSLTHGKTMDDIAGTQYDIAHVKWGGSWRMPTKEEIQELREKCTWTWTTVNGVNGQKVTGPNGNSIFFPATGYRIGLNLIDAGEKGYYWSSTPRDGSSEAYVLIVRPTGSGCIYSSRYNGQSVRPVSE